MDFNHPYLQLRAELKFEGTQLNLMQSKDLKRVSPVYDNVAQL